jgi:dienelactone hydrolase
MIDIIIKIYRGLKMRYVLIALAICFLHVNLIYAESHSVLYRVDGSMYGSYYYGVGKDSPLIFMVHDWDGIDDYEIKRADMLNKLGYSVFIIDMYGKGVRPEKIEDRVKLTNMLYNDREKMRKLLFTAYEKARELGENINNAVIMGYCFGGTVALEFARSGVDLKAFVSFHGGLSTPDGQDYSKTKGEILIFHGSSDKIVSIDDFANLVKELEEHNIPHEMITYGGAPHAFTVFGTENYRKVADERSWKSFTIYLNNILK